MSLTRSTTSRIFTFPPLRSSLRRLNTFSSDSQPALGASNAPSPTASIDSTTSTAPSLYSDARCVYKGSEGGFSTAGIPSAAFEALYQSIAAATEDECSTHMEEIRNEGLARISGKERGEMYAGVTSEELGSLMMTARAGTCPRVATT